LERRDDTVRITALDLTVPELGPVGSGGGGAPLVIALPRARCVPAVVDRLDEVLNAHPGPSEVHVRLDSGTQARLGEHVRVDITPSLLGDLKQVLGPACVVA
jgi:DNA polymerase-3 subunit alpha